MRLTVRDGHLFSTACLYPVPTPMRHWLMKSEPSDCSIDDLAGRPDQTVPWTGVRNFQARNFMRHEMRLGDDVFFYHSSCPEPGIAGLAKVASEPYADASQFDPASPYVDPKSHPERPKWWLVDVRLVAKTRLLRLAEMRQAPQLATMTVLKRGNRLSITPVTDAEWGAVLELLQPPSA